MDNREICLPYSKRTEKWKIIPFKIKAIKYLEINLIRVAHKRMSQSLHEETYKTKLQRKDIMFLHGKTS